MEVVGTRAPRDARWNKCREEAGQDGYGVVPRSSGIYVVTRCLPIRASCLVFILFPTAHSSYLLFRLSLSVTVQSPERDIDSKVTSDRERERGKERCNVIRYIRDRNLVRLDQPWFGPCFFSKIQLPITWHPLHLMHNRIVHPCKNMSRNLLKLFRDAKMFEFSGSWSDMDLRVVEDGQTTIQQIASEHPSDVYLSYWICSISSLDEVSMSLFLPIRMCSIWSSLFEHSRRVHDVRRSNACSTYTCVDKWF